MIELYVTPPWREDQTKVIVEGEHEDSVTNVVVAGLLAGRFEVEVLDSAGDLIPYLEYNHDEDDR